MTLRPLPGSSPSSRVSASAGDDMSSIISVVPAARAPARRAFFLSTLSKVSNDDWGRSFGGCSTAFALSSARPYRPQYVDQRMQPRRTGQLLQRHRAALRVRDRQPPVRVLVPGAREVLRAAVADRVGEPDADHAGRGAQQETVDGLDLGLLLRHPVPAAGAVQQAEA